jgi:hypothetical protein
MGTEHSFAAEPSPALGAAAEGIPQDNQNDQKEQKEQNDLIEQSAICTEPQSASLTAVAKLAYSQADLPAAAHPEGTDSASSAQPEPNPAQRDDNQPEGDQLGSDEPDKITSILKSDTRDAHPEPCLQGESAKTTTTAGSCPKTDISVTPDQQSVRLGSFTSPEPSPGHRRADISYKGDLTHDSGRDARSQEPCLQDESTATAITAPACTEKEEPDASQNASLTSPVPVQDKDDPVINPGRDADCPEPSEDDSCAIASFTPRAKTTRSFATSASHRGSHSARMPRKSGKQASRALQKSWARQSSPARATVLPAQAPAVEAPRGRHPVKTPHPSRTSTKAKGGDKVLPKSQASGAQHAKTNTPLPQISIVDMRGVPHVMGGLVEVSIGRKDILFGKQLQGDSTCPYNTYKVERHPFFSFPPPDMIENNREFDMELEENRPIFEPLDQDIVDGQINGFAAQTELFIKVMAAHQAEFDTLYNRFLSQKAELKRLNDLRQRGITGELARPPIMDARARAKLFSDVTEAKIPVIKEMEVTRRELKEVIIRGRVKISRGLRRDLRAPDMIDEKRARALQRITIEEQATDLGMAGVMIGLRGGLNEQTHSTQTTIQRYTQHVVDERLKEFDQLDDSHKPDKSVPAKPPSNVDTVITTVPQWFTILDAKGTVDLSRATPLDRYKELLHVVGNVSAAAREEEWLDESRPYRHSWDKEYHEPNPNWSNELQRSRGGWWRCRSDPDAPPAERYCSRCHRGDQPAPAKTKQVQSAKERYQHIVAEIDAAKAEAMKRDELTVKYQLQQERQDIDEYWQRREWIRSGGGVDITEVLHGRSVNELNYRSSAGRSQSWQQEVVKSQSGELLNIDKTSTQKTPPRETTARKSSPQHTSPQEAATRKILPEETHSQKAEPMSSSPRGSQFHELLSSGQPNSGYSRAPGNSRSSQRFQDSGFYESLSGKQVNSSPPQAAIPSPSPRRLWGAPGFHELLSGRQFDSPSPPEKKSHHTVRRQNSSRQNELFLAMLNRSPPQVESGYVSPPQPIRRSTSSQAHEVLPGMKLNRSPPQFAPQVAPPQSSLDREISTEVREFLQGMQLNKTPPTQVVAPARVPPPAQIAPPSTLHRHNSSQAHDLIHGRQPAETTTTSGHSGRPRELRSSMSRPGNKRKPQKRVSWQL